MGMEHFVIVGETVIDEFKISNSRSDHDYLNSINAFFNTLTTEERKLIDIIDEYSLEASRELEHEDDHQELDSHDDWDEGEDECYGMDDQLPTLTEEQQKVINKYNAYFEIDSE